MRLIKFISLTKTVLFVFVSIVDEFSCRLGGLKDYKKVIKEEKEVLTNEIDSQSSS